MLYPERDTCQCPKTGRKKIRNLACLGTEVLGGINMKIAVIGAGAMGSLFGGLLAEAGNEVYLVDVNADHVAALSRNGLSIESNGETRVIPVHATQNPANLEVMDLIIIQVKTYATQAAAESAIPMIGTDTVVMTMQNGIGNVELVGEVVGEENVIVGVTLHGAVYLGPGKIRHTVDAATVIGELDGRITPRLRRICDVLNEARLNASISPNIQGEIWSKAIINVPANPLCAILRIPTRELVEHECIRQMMHMAEDEVIKVAAAKGIKLAFTNVAEKLASDVKPGSKQIASMLQDVLNERPTEIGSLNGVVVSEGEKLGIETPINKLLYLMVKAIEATYDARVERL